MSVPGAYFEVTGERHELERIWQGIDRNDGRLSSDSSASLDLWLEMLDEWFEKRDAKAGAAALREVADEWATKHGMSWLSMQARTLHDRADRMVGA